MEKKEVCIISTYPEKGSMNIGDALIANSVQNILFDECGDETQLSCNTVWRADEWENVKNIIERSDLIVFACLAIRNNLKGDIYPYIEEIISLNKNVLVLSAGTSLGHSSSGYRLRCRGDDLAVLKWLNDNSLAFSTRAVLSQLFCEENYLDNATHSGDIAFYDKRFDERRFSKINKVSRIVVSDPHREKLFLPVFYKLVEELRRVFPGASIDVNLHSRNDLIKRQGEEAGLRVNEIYRNPESGLDSYDQYDLHVGFRVHGHVSMLKRRRPSYLIEQDGRGRDYGLTLNRRMSVEAVIQTIEEEGPAKGLIKKVLNKKTKKKVVSLACVDEIMAMISSDYKTGFIKFSGFEDEILDYNRNHKELIEYVLGEI